MDSLLTAMGKVGSSLNIQTTIHTDGLRIDSHGQSWKQSKDSDYQYTQMDSILTAMGKVGSSLKIQTTIHTDGLHIDSHGQSWKQSKDSDYHTHRWTPY